MPVNILKATIPAGGSITPAVDCTAGRIIQINTPPAWDSANITFQVSPNGVAYDDLYLAEGQELMLTCQPDRAIVVRADNWPAGRFIKIRSGPSAAPVNQTAARDFVIVIDTLFATRDVPEPAPGRE